MDKILREKEVCGFSFLVEIPRKLNHGKCTKFGEPRKLVRAKFSSCFLDFVMERKQRVFFQSVSIMIAFSIAFYTYRVYEKSLSFV